MVFFTEGCYPDFQEKKVMEKELSHWKSRMQGLLHVCKGEMKRTTVIGKKMISAGRISTALNSAHEELGELAAKELKAGRLEWDHPRVKRILKAIVECEGQLEEVESEVNKARFSGDEKKRPQSDA